MTENSLKLSKEELIKNVIESHQHGESVTQCVYKPLKEENTKYKQALDEIEKITKCSVDQDCCECPLCTLCEELCINEDNLQRIILDIISKAKGEGNNEG